MTTAERTTSITFVPTEPIEYSGKTYSEFTFKRPKVGHLAAMDAARGDMGKTLAFLAAIGNVPIPVIEELDVEDLGRLAEAIRPLTGQIFGADVADATAAPAA